MTRIFTSSLLVAITLAIAAVATSEAEAGNGGGNKKKSGFSISFGGGHHNHHWNHWNHWNGYHARPYYTRPYYPRPVNTTPAPVAAELPEVPDGATLTLPGGRFGNAEGNVSLRVGNSRIAVDVLDWSSDAIKIRLPELQRADATRARIDVRRASGYRAKSIQIWLLPVATPEVIIQE